MEKVIPARDIPRGQSPIGALDASRNESNNGDTLASSRDKSSNNPDPSDTLGDPVVEQTGEEADRDSWTIGR